jgi:abhydrolase domain-containing protein 13
MPVLMLGGARDEVVPRSQMQELWAIIRNRGRDAASRRGKKPPAAARLEKSEEDDEEEDEDEDESEKGKSGSPRPDGPGFGSGSDDRKVPPRIVVDGGNTYIEFADGTHSEYLLAHCFFYAA